MRKKWILIYAIRKNHLRDQGVLGWNSECDKIPLLQKYEIISLKRLQGNPTDLNNFENVWNL
jgi:hypothetical protein